MFLYDYAFVRFTKTRQLPVMHLWQHCIQAH